MEAGPDSERLHTALGGMSEDQLRALSRSPLVEIGAHTVTHPRLTMCSAERVETEVVEGRRRLEELTGRAVRFFAYPEGSYGEPVVEAVRRAGYDAAVAVDVPSGHVGDLFRLPRLVINRDATWRVAAKWAGLVEPVRRLRRGLGLRTPTVRGT